MHWTDILIRRRLPLDASLDDDLQCIECSYNLRGGRIGGVCPECGRAIRDSLTLLADPDAVSDGLAAIGRSSWTMFALLIVGLPLAFLGGFAFIALMLGTLLRVIGAGQLWWRGRLGSTSLAGRVNILAAVVAIELAAAVFWGLVLNVPSLTTPLNRATVLATGFFTWFAAATISLVVAAWFARGLVKMLDYTDVARELARAIAGLLLWPIVAGLLYATMQLVSSASTPVQQTVGIFVVLIALGVMLVVITFTALGLLHAANAAHSERAGEDAFDIV